MTGRRRRRRRNSGRKKWGTLFLFILVAAGAWWIIDKMPNTRHAEPDWKGVKQPVFVEGVMTGYSADGSGEALMLPLPLIQEYVDPYIHVEDDTESVILTTPSDVVWLKLNERTGERNGRAMTFKQSVQKISNEVYIPAGLLKELYGTAFHQDPDTGAVILMRAGDLLTLGKAFSKDTDELIPLRHGPSVKSPIMEDMSQGERVRIWGSEEEWYYVQTDSGYTGFIQQERVEPAGDKLIPTVIHEPSRADKEWRDKSVNLTWEAVYSRNPDTQSIGKLPGVNVVSPTWFSIVSEEGKIENSADAGYVKWAHGQNKEVWGVVTNSFNPDITTSVLSHYKTRAALIKDMLALADQYDLDGINIDFENVYTADKHNLIHFMREMNPRAREKGLVTSIDVTPKSNSEMWSAFLDRRELGKAVDYMIVMSYDEHWAASPKAGSVSSLPWAEGTVRRILEEDDVPPTKLVLGIPLYTRIWTEEGKDGGGKVSSKAVGMTAIQNLLADKKLTPEFDESTKQNYVEYQEDNTLKKIWIEDEVSLEARVDLARKYKLAGIATWTRSLGAPAAWEVLNHIHQ
ncbi:glycosyl hydrolase family 18 protein [Paenibacillus lemnae]|uniref:glycosyl hydrolase family 18 protein n=1 Tax=Paenibacillus lemnae TaxID=1330551 RepID=UPI0031B59DDB